MILCLAEGISQEGELIDYGVKLDIVDKSGAWLSYQDKKLGQGKENAKAFLKENPEIAQEIGEKIKASSISDDLSDNDAGEIEQ